jgi:hypothetical protein
MRRLPSLVELAWFLPALALAILILQVAPLPSVTQ